MVPEGWELTTVADVFDIQLGKMLNKTAKTKTPQYTYLGNSNVKWGHFDLSDLKTMHFNEKEIEKFSLKKNDILMCEGGEVGRCAIWSLPDTQIFYQKALHRLRVKNGIIPIYFLNYMQSIADTKPLDDYTSRTSIAHLTKEKLSALPVKLPPLPEQQKIAKILTTWDKAISTTEHLIENSTQQKKALMQQLLTGKKRLLDDEGQRFESEWEEVQLRQCAISLDNKRVPLNSSQRLSMRGDIPYWGANGILDYIDNYIFNEPIVLLAEDGGYFSEFSKRPIANISYGKAWVNNHAHVLTAKSNTIVEWLYYSLVHKNILAFINGGTRAKLNKGDMFLIPITLPPIEEQKKIVTVLTTADKEIELLKQQLAGLRQEKKALMQVLLTGKKRVAI